MIKKIQKKTIVIKNQEKIKDRILPILIRMKMKVTMKRNH